MEEKEKEKTNEFCPDSISSITADQALRQKGNVNLGLAPLK